MKYDIAAFIWPSYTGDEPRSRIFWPEGYGEWQTVKAMTDRGYKGCRWPRKPLWGYVNEADPEVMEMEIEAPMLSASSGSGGSDGNAGVFDDVTDDDANMSNKRRGKWGDLWC